MDITPLSDWGYGPDPLIIAGPCSAESEEQIITVAHALKDSGVVHVMRAGIWKPRSRPSSFAGEGEPALRWLTRAKKETGMAMAVEVISPDHVRMCLDHGIDMVWLGARTVSNPFSVDELAVALAGLNLPVLVKNPLGPDLDLWQGAIERLCSNGITRIAGVLRGFVPYGRSSYRNLPKWEMAIELRSRIPSLPVLCDPSHMAGRADLVAGAAQKALDMNMAGLMVEVHHDPSHALSDKAQQLSPESFNAMMNNLVFRKSSSDDISFSSRLEDFRNQIDSIDYQIIELVASRMRLSERIGEFKCRNNVTVFQLERWLEILQSRTEQGIAEGLDAGFTGSLIKLIHEESIRYQDITMARLKDSGDCIPVPDEGKDD